MVSVTQSKAVAGTANDIDKKLGKRESQEHWTGHPLCNTAEEVHNHRAVEADHECAKECLTI